MKKIFSNQKGSISLFVLVIMIFFVLYSLGIFNSVTNHEISQVKTSKRIKDIYEKDINNIDEIYLDLIEQ